MAQYPKIESTGAIGSILLTFLEVQVPFKIPQVPTEGFRVPLPGALQRTTQVAADLDLFALKIVISLGIPFYFYYNTTIYNHEEPTRALLARWYRFYMYDPLIFLL